MAGAAVDLNDTGAGYRPVHRVTSESFAMRYRILIRRTLGAMPPWTVALWVCVAASVVGCEATLVDLLVEAEGGDPADMREAIAAIGERLESLEAAGIPYDAGAEAAVAFLQEIVQKDENPHIQAQALLALGRLHRPQVAPLYVESLSSPHWWVRLTAAQALARNPSPLAAEAVIAQLRREQRPEVQTEIVSALIALGPDAALKVLLEMLIDDTERYDAMLLKIHGGVKSFSGRNYGPAEIERWQQYYNEKFSASETINEG